MSIQTEMTYGLLGCASQTNCSTLFLHSEWKCILLLQWSLWVVPFHCYLMTSEPKKPRIIALNHDTKQISRRIVENEQGGEHNNW